MRTERAYVYWVRAFIVFHGVCHPGEMGESEVERFLTWLANERRLAAATHRQALSALLFFYSKVLEQDLPWMKDIGRPRVRTRLPVVLSTSEVSSLLALIAADHRLLAQLLYGTGMRINEALQLRVKDVDFDHRQGRQGPGGHAPVEPGCKLARATGACKAPLGERSIGRPSGVFLPDALERKYPRAGASWPWFWVFPQSSRSPIDALPEAKQAPD